MSGHSKWSTIKRQKGAADTKRGQVFTKLGNAITIAVREGGGGDPASNFKLRLAMDQARAANMPKENMQRAVDRGLGKGGAGQLESVVYEGYGPGKVALVIEAATDNKNRTTGEVKSTIDRAGGSFVSPGTVSWMFSDEGVVVVHKGGRGMDEFLDLAVEAGAEDVADVGDFVEIYTKLNTLESVKRVLEEKGLAITSAELSKKPTTTVEITDSETAKKVLDLMGKLEDLDDVVKVHSNFDVAEGILLQS
ncbi:transcriptional regulator [Candidatus Curtissbacteria bacterium RIFCSPHIGHO2_01_FULL_41_11]|uniref:Probable transcriptional regulatory protein A2870_03470 n=1 Tax=Candidatus Curtissbacteria bacterium RIFCSPHIGHO2_01_FULL_41_11 TaxID=1797711 RepID=A0A1F5G5N0_9BACT|nr:MAG: transcriptional regulator [Candidatus Curtissbacteria bacterium RIFCSPHIGHO2_01_FULL_41_11]